MTFNYEGIKVELKTKLSQLSDWANILYFGTIERIVDAIAYVTNKMIYVAEFYFRESNLITATLPETILPRAQILSYSAHRKIGPEGYVEVSKDENQTYYTITAINAAQSAIWVSGDHVSEFNSANSLKIDRSTNNDDIFTVSSVILDGADTKIVVVETVIETVIDGIVYIYQYSGNSVIFPKWTKFSSEDKTSKVYSIADTTYNKNTIGNQKIQVREGIPKSFIYNAQGTSNEIITIHSDSIDNDIIEVNVVDSYGNILHAVNVCGVDDNPDNLYFVNDIVNYYCEISNNTDFLSIKIKFGDDIYARKLAMNEKIQIKYADTTGDDGNITSNGVITSIEDDIVDVEGAEAIMYVTNMDEISNGSTHETMLNIKYNSKRLFYAGYMANGDVNWKTILESHAYVSKAKIWVDIDNPTNFNKVYATAISNDGSSLTTEQENEISLWMKNQKSITESIAWQPLKVIYVLSKINAIITNQPKATVESDIETVLINNYGIQNTEFSDDIEYLNYTTILKNNVEQIKYLQDSTEFYHMEKNEDLSFDYTVVNHEILVSVLSITEPILNKQVLLQPASTELWLRRKIAGTWVTPIRIAKDLTGIGTLTGENGYNVATSSLNYVNNTISFFVDTLTNVGVYGLKDVDWKLFIAYKTQDGNAEQLKHMRITSDDIITDVDTNYSFYSLDYS